MFYNVRLGRDRKKDGLAFAAKLFVICLLCMAWQRADAATYNDTLDAWDMTSGHTPSLILDNTASPTFFKADSSRVKVVDGATSGSFGYHVSNINSFAVTVYYYKSMGKIEAYSSVDGNTWERLSTAYSQPEVTGGGWFTMVMSSVNIPSGTNYIGFTLKPVVMSTAGPSNSFSLQIGEVSITSGGGGGSGSSSGSGDGPQVPMGLTVLSSGTQVCLNWLPVTGALGYSVKRSASTNAADYKIIARKVTSTTYTDTQVSPGSKYYYGVSAETADGTSGLSDVISAAPKPGAVVFTDSLIDWDLVAGHSSHLTLGSTLANIWTAKRTDSNPGSFYYSMPGLSDFAMNVYFTGELKGQIGADVSTDGTHWTAITLVSSEPVKIDQNWYATVCAPEGKIPPNSNYLRFDLGRAGTPTDTPQLGQIRLSYAEKSHSHTTVSDQPKADTASDQPKADIKS